MANILYSATEISNEELFGWRASLNPILVVQGETEVPWPNPPYTLHMIPVGLRTVLERIRPDDTLCLPDLGSLTQRGFMFGMWILDTRLVASTVHLLRSEILIPRFALVSVLKQGKEMSKKHQSLVQNRKLRRMSRCECGHPLMRKGVPVHIDGAKCIMCDCAKFHVKGYTPIVKAKVEWVKLT